MLLYICMTQKKNHWDWEWEKKRNLYVLYSFNLYPISEKPWAGKFLLWFSNQLIKRYFIRKGFGLNNFSIIWIPFPYYTFLFSKTKLWIFVDYFSLGWKVPDIPMHLNIILDFLPQRKYTFLIHSLMIHIFPQRG